MAWDWSDTFKGFVATILGAIATLSYKKLKPTYNSVRRFLALTNRTEKIALELSILQSERLALFHTDQYPIVVKNAKMELVYCNPAFLDLTGLDNMEDALGFGFIESIHPDDRERTDRLRQNQISHPSQSYGTTRFKNIQNGNSILTVYRSKLVYNYKGELIGTIKRLYVITE